MSQRYRRSLWLLPAGVLVVALLTASNHHSAAPVANAPAANAAAQAAAVKPSLALLPAHLRVAAISPRKRFIVQSLTADAARDAVLRVGGLVTGDLCHPLSCGVAR